MDELKKVQRTLSVADAALNRELLASVQDVLNYSAALIKRSIPKDVERPFGNPDDEWGGQVNMDWGSNAWNNVMRDPDGFSIKDNPGDGPDRGFMVSRPRAEGHEERIPFHLMLPHDLQDYAVRKAPVINGETGEPSDEDDNYFGGWLSRNRDEEDEKGYEHHHPLDLPLMYLDVSENEHNPWDAATKALRGQQDAVFDLNTFDEHPTGDMMNQTHWKGDPDQPGYIFSRRNHDRR